MTHHNNIYVKSGEVSAAHSDGTLRSATPTKAGDGTPWHAAFNMRGNIIASAGPAPLFTLGSPAQWALSTFDDNLYYRKNHPDGLFPYNKSLADWQAHGVSGGKLGGQDKHSIVADPKFKDAAQGDYTLLPDSPALAHGFTQIDMSTVGPRPAARPLLTAPSPPPSRPHLVHVVVDDLGKPHDSRLCSEGIRHKLFGLFQDHRANQEQAVGASSGSPGDLRAPPQVPRPKLRRPAGPTSDPLPTARACPGSLNEPWRLRE